MAQELEARLSPTEIQEIVGDNGSREGYGAAVIRILETYFTKLAECCGEKCTVQYYEFGKGKQELSGILAAVAPYQHITITVREVDRTIHFVSTDELILEITLIGNEELHEKKRGRWLTHRLYCNKINIHNISAAGGQRELWIKTAKSLL